MGILRKASEETKKVYLDATDFIVLRSDISKREFNDIAANMPENVGDDAKNLKMPEATKFQSYLFGVLVVGWSLEEPPTEEAYNGLSAAAANAIDVKLGEHFETLIPSSAEGK